MKASNVKEHEDNYRLRILLVGELSLTLLNEGINQLDFFSNPSPFSLLSFCSAQQSILFGLTYLMC